MDDDETHLHGNVRQSLGHGRRILLPHVRTIAAGLESAPIGVVTTPGTKNPKYVPTEPRLLGFSLVDMDV